MGLLIKEVCHAKSIGFVGCIGDGFSIGAG